MEEQFRLKDLPGSAIAAFRPEMLVLARKSRGFTQTDLARRSGISQPTISRIEESGKPTQEQLRTIAETLDFPQEFFLMQDPIYGFGVGELFHRRRKQIPLKKLDQIHAEMNVRRIAVNRMLASIDPPIVALPSFEDDPFPPGPKLAARLLRAMWNVPPGPVESVSRLLDRAGILVIPGNFESPLVDAIGLWPLKSQPMIFVNEDVTQDRLRLTLMHEVGHFVLHSGWGYDVGSEIEEEANDFAAEFLMPEDEVRRDLRNLSVQRLALLKRVWKVSMAALLYRAKQLGLITDRRYQSLWTELGQLGYRTREPAEFDVVGEDPGGTYREIIRIHREDLGYSIDELARKVVALPERFRRDFLPQSGPALLKVVPKHQR